MYGDWFLKYIESVSKWKPQIHKEYRYLLLLMGLPLVDGVFVSLVLSGGLSSLLDAVLVGSFIFGGGATIGVIVSEFESNKAKSVHRIILVSIMICTVAVVQVIIAPSIQMIINESLFTIGSFITLLCLSARMLPYRKTNIVPSPAIVILLFAIISINIESIHTIDIFQLNIIYKPIIYTVISVLVSALISTVAVIYKDKIRSTIDQNDLKVMTSIGLVIIALSIPGLIPSFLVPLAVVFLPVFNIL